MTDEIKSKEEIEELLKEAREERNLKNYNTETASELIDESSIETMINTIEYILPGPRREP